MVGYKFHQFFSTAVLPIVTVMVMMEVALFERETDCSSHLLHIINITSIIGNPCIKQPFDKYNIGKYITNIKLQFLISQPIDHEKLQIKGRVCTVESSPIDVVEKSIVSQSMSLHVIVPPSCLKCAICFYWFFFKSQFSLQ